METLDLQPGFQNTGENLGLAIGIWEEQTCSTESLTYGHRANSGQCQD